MCVRLRETMPELAHDCQFSGGDTTTSYSLSSNGPVSSSGFWSKHRDDVSCNQLQKFWSDLSPQARQKLFRVDKQTLFEQARKNMYCSRCNGLLLEGFLQIVMYGKSLQQEGITGQVPDNGRRISNSRTVEDECDDDIQDPAVHPWGGLTTTRDGTLTLLDCYLYSKSLKGLQNVFGSARARERERELLYPDACGGGGRGWISQGMVGYGRGHGTRETCALHTARLSVDTLVDFWSALGEETRHSLLKMKEEDFMERLMFRFDSKRFCRDCRKNVIREFKELKELKRMRKEPRCTTWFCAADTSFQYEVTRDAIQADWKQTYADSAGTYDHFEWGVGTAQGKSDILEFENVGLNLRVQANGLDLGGLNACYITLRAWKKDGRYNELCVKAHALKGKQCVHCRLIVGDGFVTITRGENIQRFFEHAEEAEEEEDDDSMENEGSEVDGECLRPQKHAKSPELAREFLLDAATVIFKEQVEKAFREGTARQNAHSIFVSLALKLLEQRLLVACKDIITLEKQFKLLEEEEKEKREEEERKERRRAKEKEKKLRRKERLRNKEKESQPNQVIPVSTPHDQEQDLSDLTTSTDDVSNPSDTCKAEDNILSTPTSEPEDDQNLNYKHPRRKSKFWDQSLDWSDRGRFESKPDGGNRLTRSNNPRRLHSSHNRTNDGFDPHGYQNDYSYTRPKTNFQSVKKTWEPMETQKRYTYTPPTFNEPEIDTTNDSKECDSKNTEISNSNSDTCSSEGDGNTSFSFNTQNPESSFTSDSEDSKTKESPSKTPQFCENKINGITDSRNSIPEVHFPVFQPPSVGYYHQAPIGLMPMPLPNYYLFPTPFGYNMNTNGNPHFLQYHPPLTPPLVNQPIPQANGGQNGKSEKTRNTGFSLFHFGGPGDVSSGSVEIDKTLSAHACGKDAVEAEEYNLFATSNGIRFSF